MLVVTLLCYGQAARAVSVVAIMKQLAAMGLADHETKVADKLFDAGCEDTVPLSDVVKHLRDAGVPTGRALALKAALASGGLSRQVIVWNFTHARFMFPCGKVLLLFSDAQCACCCCRFSNDRCSTNAASSAR